MRTVALVAACLSLLVGCGGGSEDTTPVVDAGVTCANPKVACEGACVDTDSNRENCGKCGNACAAGEACVSGACKLVCPTGQQVCGDGKCHDLANDNANCGACSVGTTDTACPAGQVCSAGKCSATCAAGTSLCPDGRCHDTKTDNANCGGCGKACPAGQACSDGACGVSCPDGQTLCGKTATAPGACVTTASDNTNCGECGKTCASGTVCVGGTCSAVCPTTSKMCAGSCVDVRNDPANCGACGTTCTSLQYCAGSTCIAKATTTTYGQATKLADVDDFSADFLLGQAVTVTAPGKLVRFGIWPAAAGPKAVMSLYTDASGKPGTLLAQTEVFLLGTKNIEVAPTTNPTLSAGTYWLMVDYDTDAKISSNASTSTTPTWYIPLTFGTPLPSTITSPSTYNGHIFNYYIVTQ